MLMIADAAAKKFLGLSFVLASFRTSALSLSKSLVRLVAAQRD